MSIFKIADGSENYAAVIVRIKQMTPIVGADKIVTVNIFGNDVIISKDSDLNKSYVFFPCATAINTRFLFENNLFRDGNLNLDPSSKGGFFDPKGRVKAIKLKGVISTGFLIPIDSLKHLLKKGEKVEDIFLEGTSFTDIRDLWLCKKYVGVQSVSSKVEAPKSRSDKKLAKFSKLVPNQFKFHIKTPNLGYSQHMLKPGELIALTEKLHGTSAVFSNVLINKQLKWYEKLLIKLGINLVTTEYGNLYSSRTVLKNSTVNPDASGFYSADVWGHVNEKIKDYIEQGVTLYGEIVGWVPNSSSAIQKGYTYGMTLGSCEFYIYRMTYTKPNGEVIEYSWDMIKHYCTTYDLKHVPELFYDFTERFETRTDWTDLHEQAESEKIYNTIQRRWVHEQDDPKNPGKPAEGIVVRFCNHPHFKVFKLKNKRFALMETAAQDNNEVDIEEES